MTEELSNKIKTQFASMAIYKDPASTNSLFVGRNLPSFVKDFILKRFIKENGETNTQLLTSWLDEVIPHDSVKDKLGQGEQLTLLVRAGARCAYVRTSARTRVSKDSSADFLPARSAARCARGISASAPGRSY